MKTPPSPPLTPKYCLHLYLTLSIDNQKLNFDLETMFSFFTYLKCRLLPLFCLKKTENITIYFASTLRRMDGWLVGGRGV